MSYKSVSRYVSDDVVFSHSIYENFKSRKDWIHITDSYEILYYVKNNGLYTVEDKTYNIYDETIVITHPGQRHILSAKTQNTYDRYHIRFDARMLPPDFADKFSGDFCVFNAKDHPTVVALFETMDTFCQKLDGEFLSSAIRSSVCSIMFYFLSASKNISSTTDYNTNRILSRVIEYIDRTIHEPMNLEKLCNELFVSKSYLHHIFVETLKISPKKYITSKKLYLAQKDIRSGKTPTSVYANYGFTNYSSFYRAYVNHIGYPPSDETRRKDNIINNFIL